MAAAGRRADAALRAARRYARGSGGAGPLRAVRRHSVDGQVGRNRKQHAACGSAELIRERGAGSRRIRFPGGDRRGGGEPVCAGGKRLFLRGHASGLRFEQDRQLGAGPAVHHPGQLPPGCARDARNPAADRSRRHHRTRGAIRDLPCFRTFPRFHRARAPRPVLPPHVSHPGALGDRESHPDARPPGRPHLCQSSPSTSPPRSASRW